ncbi:MAG: hypothetical protein KIS77_17760 [Saprospiraceae bacterium]|nr:hypothetical protein [Saprospiraceae bacterium]
MKRILVWVLILQFATGHNLLAELARMPSLIGHFHEHRSEAPGLSFAHFLWLHYLDNSHKHDDRSHEHLPLHCSHHPLAESVLPQSPIIELAAPAPLTERTGLPLHHKVLATDDYASGLFRPPIA